jgi:N-acetylglucosaminyl-diphospho-decaprenol L-rhamnosyltransferase
VVDNASTDASAEMVEQEFPWVQVVASDENLGFGRAVNEVARRSQARWIAPANADIELRAGSLSRLLVTGESDHRIGAVAPRLITPDGSTQHSVHPFPGIGVAVCFNLGLAGLVPGLGDRMCLEGHWKPDRPRTVDWAHGAFLLVRRRAFDEIGGFDSRQWMYAEDLDLCWRLGRAGWTVRYEAGAPVRHEVSAATREAFADERPARHITAAYGWMARRRGMTSTWSYAVLNAGGAALRALALAPLARIAPERFGARRQRNRRYAHLHRLGLRRRAALLARLHAGR